MNNDPYYTKKRDIGRWSLHDRVEEQDLFILNDKFSGMVLTLSYEQAMDLMDFLMDSVEYHCARNAIIHN